MHRLLSIPSGDLLALSDTLATLSHFVQFQGVTPGVDYLLRVVHRIVYGKGRRDIRFILIGEGPEWQGLKRYCSKLKLDSYVTFTGRVSDKEMVEYLSTCDVCVNPDVVNEFNDKSTMNKVLEYMVLGKPIVQFDMVEGRYSAQKASLYANPNDEVDFAQKILELLGNAEKRKEMDDYGRQRVEKQLQWKFSEKELLRAYRSLFSVNPWT